MAYPFQRDGTLWQTIGIFDLFMCGTLLVLLIVRVARMFRVAISYPHRRHPCTVVIPVLDSCRTIPTWSWCAKPMHEFDQITLL